jgi:transcriptional regulator with GAF, ATPase, and Fis domain
VSHLGLEPSAKPRGDVASDLGGLERDTIMRVLQECEWNKAQAAKRLGLTRTQLYGRMHKYMIEQERPASAA